MGAASVFPELSKQGHPLRGRQCSIALLMARSEVMLLSSFTHGQKCPQLDGSSCPYSHCIGWCKEHVTAVLVGLLES